MIVWRLSVLNKDNDQFDLQHYYGYPLPSMLNWELLDYPYIDVDYLYNKRFCLFEENEDWLAVKLEPIEVKIVNNY